MRLGLVHVNMGSMSQPDALAKAAREAEAAGFDSVWAGEHVVLPDPQVPPSPMHPQDPALDPLRTRLRTCASQIRSQRRDRGPAV